MEFDKMCTFIVLLTLISSCNEYEKLVEPALKAKLADKNSNVMLDGEIEPSIPNPSDNDRTVLGIDTNKNGIRDDIDIWINRTAVNSNERMAMRQYAKAKQFWLKVCSEDLKEDVMEAENGVLDSGTCLGALSNYKSDQLHFFEKKIDILSLNISKRSCGNYYYQHSTVVTISNSSTPHLNCKFTIEKVDEVVRAYNRARRNLK